MSDLTGLELCDAVARVLGWVDYPTDSAECGDRWHTEPSKAPFGPTIRKADFRPDLNWSQCGKLIDDLGIEFKWLTDATVEAHSIILSSTGVAIEGHRIAACRAIAAAGGNKP